MGIPLIADRPAECCRHTKYDTSLATKRSNFSRWLRARPRWRSENAQLYAQTKTQAIELDKANKLQADFAAMIAHDLRSPLTSIMGSGGE
jgi:signal transduction histidine kinase